MARRVRGLRRLGKVWAIVEGKVVVKGERMPRLGEKVYASDMRELGVVSSVFGKEEEFYVEVKPIGGASISEGTALYLLEESKKPGRKLPR